MKNLLSYFLFFSLFTLFPESTSASSSKRLLGQLLFFDNNLSLNRTQSCSTCHNPDTAFVDLRDNPSQRMVSQGDDPHKYGNRNTPTAMYGMYTPSFHFDPQINDYVGGQFWDGRVDTLAQQAGKPPLNPVEMGMLNKAEVVKRLADDETYRQMFATHYGENIWQRDEAVYAAMEEAIGVFETEKKWFKPFSSKYDKFLRGEAQLTALEEQGRALFFDRTKTHCSNCHQLRSESNQGEETFTNYRYFNLGVPKNPALIALNRLDNNFVDNGLLDNPAVKGDMAQKGKFKVPTLRNVAVTAPYMHNGVFKALRTVLLFLDHYNNPKRVLNPETGKPWAEAEYAPTIAHNQLNAPALSNRDIDALEAFLNALTDEKFEPLLKIKSKEAVGKASDLK